MQLAEKQELVRILNLYQAELLQAPGKEINKGLDAAGAESKNRENEITRKEAGAAGQREGYPGSLKENERKKDWKGEK